MPITNMMKAGLRAVKPAFPVSPCFPTAVFFGIYDQFVRLQLSANNQVRCFLLQAAKNSPGDRNVALTREQKIAHVAVQPGPLDLSGFHFALINTDRHATTGNRFLNA